MIENCKSAKKRIAILLPDLRPGGAERMRLNMAPIWIEKGYEVDFVLLEKKGELLDLLPNNVNLVNLNVDRYRFTLQPLIKYLNEVKPDTLLAAMWPLTIIAILAKGLSYQYIRVVISDHNTLSKAYAGRGLIHRLILRLSMGMVYPFANERIAVSKGVAADLSSLSGLSVERFRVIYNPAAHTNNSEKECTGKPALFTPGKKIILTVGTLKYQKDQALLIEAFFRIRTKVDAQLFVLGEGELRPQLEMLIRDKSLEEFVFMPGFCSSPSVYYQAADVFVLSSRYEGFGNVIVEALSHGLPVISTDCPSGPREILENGEYGSLVPVGDPQALAEAMLNALQVKHDTERLKRRAQEFRVDKIAEQYLKVMFPYE